MTNSITPEGEYVLCLSHMSMVPDDESAYEVNGEGEGGNLYFHQEHFDEALEALQGRIEEYKEKGWTPVKVLYVDMTVDANEPYVTAIDHLSEVPHKTMGVPQEGTDLRPARKMGL